MPYQEHSSAVNMASAFSAAASRERCLCVPFPDAITLPSTMEGFMKNHYGQMRQNYALLQSEVHSGSCAGPDEVSYQLRDASFSFT